VTVLAIDPGREKCGVAVCRHAGVVVHRVVRVDELAQVARQWIAAYGVDLVLLGNGTGSRDVRTRLSHIAVPVEVSEEQGTTLAARRRFFQDHPPRGWRRLLPRSLQTPAVPYDDYAAIVLAETYLGSGRKIEAG
jgi:RNase H-fold protein (predicted Holliday junction resolvase)